MTEYHYAVKCPECGAKRDTTTLNRVRCHDCGYSFVAREYLTKEPVCGHIPKNSWDGFITAREMCGK